MKTLIAILYFAYFGFCWPVYVGKRTRGVLTLACMSAPWIAFWAGWFAR